MKIKTLILFLMFLSLNANGQNLTEINSLKIIGKWGIYVTRTSQVDKKNDEKLLTFERVCNSCPEITFSVDKVARLDFPNGGKQKYKWKIKNEKISFVEISGNQNKKFLDSEYNIKFIDKKSYLEMELELSEDESYTYVLRK